MKLSELKKTLIKPTVEPVRNVYESGNRRSLSGRELPARTVVVPAPPTPTRTLSRIFGERVFQPVAINVKAGTLDEKTSAVGGKSASVTTRFLNPFAPSPLHVGGVLLEHSFESRKEHIVHDEDTNTVTRRHLRRDAATGFLVDDGPAV